MRPARRPPDSSAGLTLIELMIGLGVCALLLSLAVPSFSAHLQRQVPTRTLTREQVRSEVLAARRSGAIAAMTGEDSGSFHLASLQHVDPYADPVRYAHNAR